MLVRPGEPDLSRVPLFTTTWTRVVLDEAHRIKGRTNSTASAAFALRATRSRWCLTGTPLQNKVGELYSLCRFLRFYPFAHYFCRAKDCECASLYHRFDPETQACEKCGHAKGRHWSYFVGKVTSPIQNFGCRGMGAKAMERLRLDVLDKVMLRRTKAERQADMKLPELSVDVRWVELSAEERDFYSSLHSETRTQFDTYVKAGTLLQNYASVFELVLRLRQAVAHPDLIVHSDRRVQGTCGICQDDVERCTAESHTAKCGHTFHLTCWTRYVDDAPEEA